MNDMSKALIGTIVAVFLFVGGMHVARADTLEWKNQVGDRILLLDEPCTDEKVVKWIKEEYKARHKKMDTTMDGKRPSGCWMANSEDESKATAYWMIFEDGGHSLAPKGLFKRLADV